MFEITVFSDGDRVDSNQFRSIMDARKWAKSCKVEGRKTTTVRFVSDRDSVKREYTGNSNFGE